MRQLTTYKILNVGHLGHYQHKWDFMDKKQTDYVTVIHHYDFSSEVVFDAFLNPKKAEKFMFRTPTGEIVKAEIDPKVGGQYVIIDRRDGQDVVHTGEYLEIKKPHRLVFTFLVPQYASISTKVEIDVFDVNDGCELTLKHSGVLPEYREKTKEGWAKMLMELSHIL